MPIKGLEKFTTLDYFGKDSAIIFFDGCNFRCPYCQNPDLVTGNLPDFDKQEVLEFLERRKKWLDGVVISGGEPLINSDLEDFLIKVKDLKYNIKLYTNGSKPEMLEYLINNNLVDDISMDIKGPLDRYEEITRSRINLDDIEKSIKILKYNKINYEFRTTVVPSLVNKEDLLKIGQWLKGSKKYILQGFKSDKKLLDKNFEGKKNYGEKEMLEFGNLLKDYFDVVEII